MATDPYASWRAGAQGQFTPTGSSGGFSEWLSSLPTPQQLTPLSSYVSGRRGETGIGPNQIPAIWMQFAPYGSSLINQAAMAQRGAATAGAANSRREFERALLGSYQNQGVDPAFARRQLAEQRPQVGYQLQQQLGGIEAGRLGQQFDLQQGITNALAQASAGERQMSLEAFLASRARKAARSGARSAANAQIFSSGFDALVASSSGGGGGGGGGGG